MNLRHVFFPRGQALAPAASMVAALLLTAASPWNAAASDGPAERITRDTHVTTGDNGDASSAQTGSILSLTLSPTTIAGGSGDTSTGTVTLNAPAPAGGTIVTLTSSNIELAATLPTITVPEGATTATFVVGTNAGYRAYSALSFSVNISATHLTTRSATLNFTAQPRPPDFNSGSTAGANTQWQGSMCGGLPPIGGRQGILYSCSPPDESGFGTCTFLQECALGCRRVPPSAGNFNDFCATSGPNPVSLSRNYIVGGDHVAASIVLEAPAGNGQDQEVGSPGVIAIDFNASFVPHAGGIVFPDGTTTVPFTVGTSYVPTIQFVDVQGFWFNASIPPLLITNGRAGHQWLAMVPPDPPPAVALPTLLDFVISGLNPIVGGDSTFGQVDLSGLSRAGGPTLTLTSSHPAIVPDKTIVAPVSENLFGFQAFFESNPVATDTDVTVTLSDGRYSFSDVLTVRAAPPPPVLADVSVNPTSVVGGSSATGTVTLSAPQSGPTIVEVSIVDTAPASFPTNDAPCPPSSRCHNVTVPAGATTANFTINTSAVTSQFNLNVFADLPGSPGQQALLLIMPGGPTIPRRIDINPSDVVGGVGTNGLVTLTAAAPSGGAVVTLSKALANGGAGTVPVTIPASVTVPAGQTTASFPIATSSVTAFTVVRISGTYNGTTVNGDMSLSTNLRQLLFDPSNVVGGTTSTGTVTLGVGAPSGGAVITLTSMNTSLATVPATVTVPAGQTSATFTANTSVVTTSGGVEIRASYQGVTVSGGMFLLVSRAVSSVTLSPSSLVGPASSTATVTLVSDAPSGNALVSLASSNTVLATVPFSIIVPSGQRTATFTVNAAQVTQTSTVVISATYENVTRSATLTINPSGAPAGPTLSALTLNPASVAGGAGSTATVTLSAAAPSGGVAVSLSDNSAAAATPGSVTVPAGATSATFNVTTTAVGTTTIATVTATAGSSSRTADLTITAAGGGGGGGGGFVGPATNAPDSGGDGNGFQSSPANAHTADGAVATDTNSGSGTSTSCTNSRKDRHRFYNFGLVIPDGSAVAGIEVRLDARADSTAGAPRMCVQLSWDGGTTWTAAQATGTLGTTLSTVTLGGAADNWGRTWSAADLTNANFRLRIINVASSTSRDFFLDWVAVLPHFTTIGPAALSGIAVSPTSVTGGTNSQGTVTLTSAAPAGGAVVSLSSSDAGAAGVPSTVTIAAGASSATFTATTASVASNTPVTLTATYEGTSRTATLTVLPEPPPASLQGVGVNPATVTGGASSQGSVTLSSAAPAGGLAVLLASNNAAAASVPASATVAAGATSATFTVTTSAVGASTPVTITASHNGVTRTATLTVNPPAPTQNATLTVTATGRSGESISSSPAGISVNVGSTGSASFASGTSITLSVSDGRDAVWSGACSSGGDKTRTCTFTLTGSASVTANVQ